MMRNLLLLMFALCAISSCVSLSVDEAYVFRPDRVDPRPSEAPSAKMLFEDIFTKAGDFTIEVDANGERARYVLTKEAFIPSTVTHGWIEAGEDVIAYTLVKRSGQSRPLVVHCGGNAADRYNSGSLYAQKVIGFADVLLFDYPGYGESSGKASTQSLQSMSVAVAEFTATELSPRQKLVLWGHSIGGFVCGNMASRFERVDAIIFETSAANATDVSKVIIPWYLKPFVKVKVGPTVSNFDNVAALSNFQGRILVIGAGEDRTLPVELSDKLAMGLKTHGGDVDYVRLNDANHISVATVDGFAPSIRTFFDELQLLQQESVPTN